MRAATAGPPRWAVHLIDPVFGVGKRLGSVRAADHRAAELLAANQFPGKSLLVSLAGGRARSKREPHFAKPGARKHA